MNLLEQKNWFDSAEFEEAFHCDAPLGAFPSPEGTTFRLWAPTARSVTLFLYPDGGDSAPKEAAALRKGERGLWEYKTAANLDGIYYDYEVNVDGRVHRTADPYARACGVNGYRSMVLDLRRTDPEGWDADRAPDCGPEQIIYELHVKDFSWDEAGGFPARERGKYLALCRTGTTLNGDGAHPTGLDWLKSLGVTHIQLMPVYDFGSVDETGSDRQYNWGYDPANYNIPEGSYSSDPWHGEVRVKELKQAVQALHANGFRVVMDVVYNHTYALDSWLWRTVPWYYYRQNEDGTASNGSGCGNELASERSMCAKYILDSVLYWAEAYHIDGFRFDLMGLLDVELMNRIRAALDERYGAGEKLIYGEPWAAAGSAVRPGTCLANKDHLWDLDDHVGAFCDSTRDAVKGGLGGEKDAGFVNGGGISAWQLRRCVTGWAGFEFAPVKAPSQTVTYLSCHDDWTLWDKLVFTLSPRRAFRGRLPKVQRANRLAAAINFFCQGYPFLLAGEEFGRTKDGVKNSYRSSPDLNRLDWTRAWEQHRLADYYSGLIALRKKLPCLCDKSPLAPGRLCYAEDLAPGCAAVALKNPEGPWDQVMLVVHTGGESLDVALPEGRWQVLVDGTSAFRWEEYRVVEGAARLAPVSALILGRKPD